MEVLVVYRTGVVRSGVLSLIAKAWDLQSAAERTRAFGSRVISASQTIWFCERVAANQLLVTPPARDAFAAVSRLRDRRINYLQSAIN
jgi:hypothetical protein